MVNAAKEEPEKEIEAIAMSGKNEGDVDDKLHILKSVTTFRSGVAFDPNMVNAAKEEPEKEIEAITMYTEGVASIVVDTRMKCLSRGEAPKLAQKPGGRYFYRYKAIIS